MRFRPCIDLRNGRVVQIVGSTLRADGAEPETHFVSDEGAARVAARYAADGLSGGHVIMLGTGNEAAATEALKAFPGGLQVGGGIGAAVNGNRQSQAHIAVGLNRFGDKVTPRGIIASLKERSVNDEEMGMFWRDTEHSWWWYRAPIETQAMMIEALHEVAQDFDNVEECKVWLLKQKQTRDWKTTKATADACYALLLQGANWLASEALVEVTVGDTKIDPKTVEAGTGFYEHRFLSSDVKP